MEVRSKRRNCILCHFLSFYYSKFGHGLKVFKKYVLYNHDKHKTILKCLYLSNPWI